jgi:2-oxoglutarate ferredoxin oxidoreductase subunit beta
MTQDLHFARKYLREEVLPSSFCSGCGLGTIINSFLKAVGELGYSNLKEFVFCSGIGCSSWIPSPHFQADTIHTTHGRSLPVALGLRLVRPDIKLVVFGGDGDLTGIGLNHLVQSARRNLDVTVIMANNMIYGMTGGQVAPTTPLAVKTSTTPYGAFEYPLDVSRLMVAAGACYVARWTTYHVVQLKEAIKKVIPKEGFSFIEVVTQCPPIFGRRVGMDEGVKMLRWFRENSIPVTKAKEMGEKELLGKIVVGEFVNIEKPGLLRNIQAVRERATS